MSEFALNRLTKAMGFVDAGELGLKGESIGVARAVCGMARVIHEDSDLDELREGDILIANTYNVAWRPQLSMLRGVVVASDDNIAELAQASHELELPVVSGVPGLIDRVATGMVITCSVNGEIGQLDDRRRPDSPMRVASPGARTSRQRLAEGPGHFGAATSWSVVDGGASSDEEVPD